MKNTARLPRTAGLRTLSELTTELTKAGLDPSRIQERAEILAKAQGAKRKREREEEEAEMDVDGPGAEDGEGDWMDVDEDATPAKRAKANSGAAVSKGRREPASNRQFAGLRDDAVSAWCLATVCLPLMIGSLASIQGYQAAESRPERTQYASQGGRERSCYQDQDGKESTHAIFSYTSSYHSFHSRNICSQASGRWAKQIADSSYSVYGVLILCFLFFSLSGVACPCFFAVQL